MKNLLKRLSGVAAREEAYAALEEAKESLHHAQELVKEAEYVKQEANREAEKTEQTRREVEAMLQAVRDAQEESKKLQVSPKDQATERGEPWVEVISMEIDPSSPGDGSFELDWNDKFITNLVRAGYKGKSDADLVDQWFRSVCRNILQEGYEQWEANYATMQRSVKKNDLGDGRTSVS